MIYLGTWFVIGCFFYWRLERGVRAICDLGRGEEPCVKDFYVRRWIYFVVTVLTWPFYLLHHLRR